MKPQIASMAGVERNLDTDRNTLAHRVIKWAPLSLATTFIFPQAALILNISAVAIALFNKSESSIGKQALAFVGNNAALSTISTVTNFAMGVPGAGIGSLLFTLFITNVMYEGAEGRASACFTLFLSEREKGLICYTHLKPNFLSPISLLRRINWVLTLIRRITHDLFSTEYAK